MKERRARERRAYSLSGGGSAAQDVEAPRGVRRKITLDDVRFGARRREIAARVSDEQRVPGDDGARQGVCPAAQLDRVFDARMGEERLAVPRERVNVNAAHRAIQAHAYVSGVHEGVVERREQLASQLVGGRVRIDEAEPPGAPGPVPLARETEPRLGPGYRRGKRREVEQLDGTGRSGGRCGGGRIHREREDGEGLVQRRARAHVVLLALRNRRRKLVGGELPVVCCVVFARVARGPIATDGAVPPRPRVGAQRRDRRLYAQPREQARADAARRRHRLVGAPELGEQVHLEHGSNVARPEERVLPLAERDERGVRLDDRVGGLDRRERVARPAQRDERAGPILGGETLVVSRTERCGESVLALERGERRHRRMGSEVNHPLEVQ